MSESDPGTYFAWGEVTPKDLYKKYNYKYNVDISNPPTPPSVLPASEDAASVNLGGSWRMPTKAEMEALLSSCTWERTTANGMNGYRVSRNGKSIFLPYAGSWEDRQGGLNSGGGYMTSTLKEVISSAYEGPLVSAWALSISDTDREEFQRYIAGFVGYYGHTIRAVCP